MRNGYKLMSLIQESLSVTTQTLFHSGRQIQMHMCRLHQNHALVSIQRCQANTVVGSLCGSTMIVRTGFSSWARTSSGTAAIPTDQRLADSYLRSRLRELFLGPYILDQKVFSLLEGINIEDMVPVFMNHSIFRIEKRRELQIRYQLVSAQSFWATAQ